MYGRIGERFESLQIPVNNFPVTTLSSDQSPHLSQVQYNDNSCIGVPLATILRRWHVSSS